MTGRLVIAISALILILSAAHGLAAPAPQASSPYVPSDAERARWTMADMRSLVIAMEAYKKDHGEYAKGETLQGLLAQISPVYIRRAPATDAWGNAYRYAPLGATGFRIVSAGADGAFSLGTWGTAERDLAYAEDAVAEAGALTRTWKYE
ncbi:MAG TPA: type II secretion system protein GspG [Verrucomicrobiae bacterium]|nr:type II secretion system protein GspG [Verrucomicrobiae bacterium]